MFKFAIEKNIGERQVRRIIKIGSVIDVTLQEENFTRQASIKITKFTVGKNALFIQGIFANGSYILNILEKKWMCLSDTEMKNGKILGGVYSGQNTVTFDAAVGEFYYNDIERNVKKFVPVEAGDELRKDGNNYKILAVASDGAIFVERIYTKGDVYYKSQKSSLMIRTNDLSGYSVFDGLEVIND